jgi:hypothetical protein
MAGRQVEICGLSLPSVLLCRRVSLEAFSIHHERVADKSVLIAVLGMNITMPAIL